MKQQDRIKKKPSVRLNIFGGFIIFTVVTLLLLWLFQVVFLERIYKTFCISELEKSAETLADNINDTDKLTSTAVSLAEKYNICIAMLVPEDKTLTRLTDVSYSGCYLYSLSLDECETLYGIAKVHGGAEIVSISYDESNGYMASLYNTSASDEIHSVVYTLVSHTDDEKTVVLLLNSVITPIGATIKTINLLLVIISGVLVLFAAFLAIFISHRIATPIVQMNQKAKVFASGAYEAKFNANGGYREVNELASTLNFAGVELSKVENLRRELISNISHDLRTPLTLIQGYSEAMRDLPGECNPENLQTVVDETRRLTSIVNEMLDYSKIQSGNYSPELETLELSAVIGNAVATYRTLIEKNGYQIDYTDKCGTAVFIKADKTMLVRALYNLINNAVTHTGDDKKVAVQQSPADGFVRIEVIDSGCGIAKDKLELIWERYYKADTEHKRAAMGTGLGLSIVKSIVIMHNGRFGVRSREGFGSTFWIELPISDSGTPNAAAAQ